jgi:hypothetical protein
MELKLVNFETAVLANYLGFNWPCYYSYEQDNNSSIEPIITTEFAPTYIDEVKFTIEEIENAKLNGYTCFLAPEQDLLCKWLREIHNLHINISHKPFNQQYSYSITSNYNYNNNGIVIPYTYNNIQNYEDCVELAIKKCLEIVKDKQDKNK